MASSGATLAEEKQSPLSNGRRFAAAGADAGLQADFSASPEWRAAKEILGLTANPGEPGFDWAATVNTMLRLVPREGGPSTSTYRIHLSFPGPGGFGWGAVKALLEMGRKHEVQVSNAGGGWDSFNAFWCEVLAYAKMGKITHAAMIHSDVSVSPGWMETLIAELDAGDLHLVSVPAAIKDGRGVMSCGIGDPNDRWCPLRRITAKEMVHLPETFTAADYGYPGGILLHNNACWAADLRKPEWFTKNPDGTMKIFWDFPRRLVETSPGVFANQGESEDWFFSRQCHEVGMKTAITRKVSLNHRGIADFPNDCPWGANQHDEDTRAKWRPLELARAIQQVDAEAANLRAELATFGRVHNGEPGADSFGTFTRPAG